MIKIISDQIVLIKVTRLVISQINIWDHLIITKFTYHFLNWQISTSSTSLFNLGFTSNFGWNHAHIKLSNQDFHISHFPTGPLLELYFLVCTYFTYFLKQCIDIPIEYYPPLKSLIMYQHHICDAVLNWNYWKYSQAELSMDQHELKRNCITFWLLAFLPVLRWEG